MNEEVKKLRTWIMPKEVQIQEIKQQLQSQELMIKQINENVKLGFYVSQQEKSISEQLNESSKKLHELELERIKRDLNNSYYQQKAQLVLNGLKELLKKEEKILGDLKKKITMVGRNHKIEVKKPEEEPKTIPEGMTKEEAGKSKEDPNTPNTGRSFQ